MSDIHMDGIWIDGQKAKFLPTDILDGNIEEYTGPIADAVEDYLADHIAAQEFVVDKTFATENAAASAKLTGDRLTAIETGMETKAEIDGYYEEMTVGDAEQLVSTRFVEDEDVYQFRSTGGSVDVGNRAYIDKIEGASIVWNQLVQNGNFESIDGWSVNSSTASVAGNILTLKVTSINSSGSFVTSSMSSINSHKYLMAVSIKSPKAVSARMSYPSIASGTNGISVPAYTWTRVADIIMVNTDTYFGYFYYDVGAVLEVGDELQFKNAVCFDLTAMFGATIADYIYALEQATAGAGVAFFKSVFPKAYYEYNAGELVHVSQLTSRDTVGLNQWDGVWEVGGLDNTAGLNASDNASWRSKNYIPMLPNKQYSVTSTYVVMYFYDADKKYISHAALTANSNGYSHVTTPDGTRYARIKSGSGISKEVTIMITWSGAHDGEHEEYEKHSYPLDSDVVLRGIVKPVLENGKIVDIEYDGDEYLPDGTVKRKYGIVDLGTLNWSLHETSEHLFYSFLSDRRTGTSDITFICSKYAAQETNTSIADMEDKCIKASADLSNKAVFIRDDAYTTAASFKTAMSGVYLVYELAEPTTETADAYNNVQIVNDWGTEEFVTTGLLPVQAKCAYPINLRDKLQHLPNMADDDGTYIITQTDGDMELTPFSSMVDASLDDTSELPVQNKTVAEAVTELTGKINAMVEDKIASDFIAARTGKVWKRKVWKTAANTTPECPALDDYNDGVATPFTDNVAGSDPYMDNYRVFQWMHCNYVRDEDGTARPIAVEGDTKYQETGAVDIGTVRPTFWWKWEDTDAAYWTLYFSDSPHEELGLVPWKDAVTLNGKVLPYFVVASYASVTASDGKLRSQKGKPANNASYNNLIAKYQSKGNGYWGSGSSIMSLAMIDLIVKYKTKLEQNVSKGNSQFNVSEAVLVAETGVKRVLVDATCTKFSKGDGVTVGTTNGAHWLNGNVVSWAVVSSVETVTVDGTSYKAIYLDVENAFNTTTSLYICGSACPSGQTDAVMGHYDGALISNTDGKHAFRIGGVEHMNGLWFVFADTVIEFLSNSWKVFVAPKGTAHVSGAHTNYKQIGYSSAFVGDAYVGNISFDEETGGFYHAEAGNSNATGTGSHHWNGGTDVTEGTLREWLGVGRLYNGASGGFCYCDGGSALSYSNASSGSRD